MSFQDAGATTYLWVRYQPDFRKKTNLEGKVRTVNQLRLQETQLLLIWSSSTEHISEYC